jgi:hypothetical protein
MKKQQEWHSIEVDFDGKTYKAQYSTSSSVISVRYMDKDGVLLERSEIFGQEVYAKSHEEFKARRLLRELLEELKNAR